MRKMAIFVEGKTELIFIEKLLGELAGIQNIEIKKRVLQGQERCPFIEEFNDENSKYKIRIYNSCNDSKVLSDILENYNSLISKKFTKIIGLRDLYPSSYDKRNMIQNVLNSTLEEFNKAKIIIATMEVETWFIAELNHYKRIDEDLTLEKIKNELIDLESIENFEKDIVHPAEFLHYIYKLVNKKYTTRKLEDGKEKYKKKEKEIKRTVEALDYENLYLNTKEKVPSLKQLIDELDKFFKKEDYAY